MRFAHPALLWLGAGLVVLVLIGLRSHARRRRRLADLLGGPRAASRVSSSNLYRIPFARLLLLGAGALVSAGSALILICLAGADRFVSPVAGVTGALLLNLSAAILAAIRLRGMDELNRRVALDASHLALTSLIWFGGTWAVLAHVRFTPAPDALDWLTMLHGFGFIAGLVAAARRGVFEANRPRAT